MKAYYSDALITLYHGDCLSYLPALAFDAIITDPPYGMNLKTDYKARKRGALAECNNFPLIVGDDKPFDPEPFLKFKTVILFGANWYADKLPISGAWLVWDKLNGLTSKRDVGFNDNSDCELAWTNKGKAVRLLRHRWMGMLKDSEQTERRVHPTQKPVALMEQIIKAYTKEGDTVCDPYMGGGSTGIACVRTGRRFIGVEISEEYCAIAKQRIQDAQACTPQALRSAGESLPAIARKLKLSVPEVARMLRGVTP